MIFTEENAKQVKDWIDRQVGKKCVIAEVGNRPENIATDECYGFMSYVPSGDTHIYLEFTPAVGVEE